ncbi:hypothetical protein RZE82_05630 [Mollicutes bacterium LVI A0039]|nr:hypothetical protein RZE82_05630 [Mollicutes bacterium LVI A0039]
MTPLHIIQGNLELAQSGMELDLDIVRKQVDRLSYFVKMNVAMQECKLENINSNDIKTYI